MQFMEVILLIELIVTIVGVVCQIMQSFYDDLILPAVEGDCRTQEGPRWDDQDETR
jgi:hypothetical protein